MKTACPTLTLERQLWQQGYSAIAGLDEVGRGSLAGPVVTAAVIFPPNHRRISGVRDSKQLNRAQREILAEKIKHKAVAFSIGVGALETINTAGLMTALCHAFGEARLQLKNSELCLVDGLPLTNADAIFQAKTQFLVKGDQRCYSIAAASILAKVYRDQLMAALAPDFPEYGWGTNAGYATDHHCRAIRAYGLTPHHRLQFCQSVLAKLAQSAKNPSTISVSA